MPVKAWEAYEDNLNNSNNYLLYLFLNEIKELTKFLTFEKSSDSTRSKFCVELKLSTLLCFVYERERGLDCACADGG